MGLLRKFTQYPLPKILKIGLIHSSGKNGMKYVASEGRGLEKYV